MVLTTATAHADRHLITVADRDSDEQIVVVNAAGTTSGQIARIHRALDQRGMLFHLDDTLEATLEGRNPLTEDLESIKNAYASADFDSALKIIDEDEKRLLEHGTGDVPISLSLLEGWRGMIAAHQNREGDALRYFRAAVRFNPAWAIDKKLPSPQIRSIIINAHREVSETGTLRTVIEPDNATVTIDGNEQKAAGGRIKLPVGYHLVQISADGMKTLAEIVDIADGKAEKIDETLQPAGQLDKAAKLLDEAVAAPPGERLERARSLATLTGSNRILMIEGANEDHVNVRLYDISLKKVSKTFSLDGSASSAAIVHDVKSAFEGGTSNTLPSDPRDDGEDGSHSSKWYSKWYWYAGAAVLLGGIILTYDYASREPTTLKGF
ncbi:MAG: PEGA domain-containing protein [Kofleriaceae bacterium]